MVGRLGLPGRNDNGESMIQLCVETGLVVGNPLFKKKDIHKYTWISQDNGRIVSRTMMDYVIRRRTFVRCESLRREKRRYVRQLSMNRVKTR